MNISHKGLVILKTFLESPGSDLYGYDLMRAAGVSSGTLYPILLRFEKQGLLRSEWEKSDPSSAGRPRRRMYRITGEGQQIARELLTKLAMADGVFA